MQQILIIILTMATMCIGGTSPLYAGKKKTHKNMSPKEQLRKFEKTTKKELLAEFLCNHIHPKLLCESEVNYLIDNIDNLEQFSNLFYGIARRLFDDGHVSHLYFCNEEKDFINRLLTDVIRLKTMGFFLSDILKEIYDDHITGDSFVLNIIQNSNIPLTSFYLADIPLRAQISAERRNALTGDPQKAEKKSFLSLLEHSKNQPSSRINKICLLPRTIPHLLLTFSGLGEKSFLCDIKEDVWNVILEMSIYCNTKESELRKHFEAFHRRAAEDFWHSIVSKMEQKIQENMHRFTVSGDKKLKHSSIKQSKSGSNSESNEDNISEYMEESVSEYSEYMESIPCSDHTHRNSHELEQLIKETEPKHERIKTMMCTTVLYYDQLQKKTEDYISVPFKYSKQIAKMLHHVQKHLISWDIYSQLIEEKGVVPEAIVEKLCTVPSFEEYLHNPITQRCSSYIIPSGSSAGEFLEEFFKTVSNVKEYEDSFTATTADYPVVEFTKEKDQLWYKKDRSMEVSGGIYKTLYPKVH